MSTEISARLAVLIGSPHRDQASMHHDLAAMFQALKRRGLASEEILCLEGALDRPLLLDFLRAIHHRIADWQRGELYLYITGHGFFSGKSAQDARVGVLLQPGEQVGDGFHAYWEQLFQALSVPPGVTVTMLADH